MNERIKKIIYIIILICLSYAYCNSNTAFDSTIVELNNKADSIRINLDSLNTRLDRVIKEFKKE